MKVLLNIPFFAFCRVEYRNTESVDPETHEPHEEYLAAFKRTLIEKLQQCIDNSLSNDPDGGKGKRKTVQVKRSSFCFTSIYVRIKMETQKVHFLLRHWKILNFLIRSRGAKFTSSHRSLSFPQSRDKNVFVFLLFQVYSMLVKKEQKW